MMIWIILLLTMDLIVCENSAGVVLTKEHPLSYRIVRGKW